MLVHLCKLNGRHIDTAQCTKGAERKCRFLAEEELLESLEIALKAYGEPLETVTLFKYMGQAMTAGDDDWPLVAGNLRKDWKSWTRMTRILGQEGADPRISGFCLNALVQVVLLFGSETWVMTTRMERDLGSFQNKVARQITGSQRRRRGEGNGSILRWRK